MIKQLRKKLGFGGLIEEIEEPATTKSLKATVPVFARPVLTNRWKVEVEGLDHQYFLTFSADYVAKTLSFGYVAFMIDDNFVPAARWCKESFGQTNQKISLVFSIKDSSGQDVQQTLFCGIEPITCVDRYDYGEKSIATQTVTMRYDSWRYLK